jgi:phosphinothricin acetyltransferase
MKIRLAEMDDLQSIVRIYNQAIKMGGKTADTQLFHWQDRKIWFSHYSAERYPLIVALKHNKIVGYLSLSAYRSGRAAVQHTLEVSFYIHFDYHRQGIASALLFYAISFCKKLSVTTLIAILIENNQGSIKLLESYGFQLWGCLPNIVELANKNFDHLYYGLTFKK